MEFRLPHFVEIGVNIVDVREIQQDEFAFIVSHGNKTYNSLLHDIAFKYGNLVRTVSWSFVRSLYTNPDLFFLNEGTYVGFLSFGQVQRGISNDRNVNDEPHTIWGFSRGFYIREQPGSRNIIRIGTEKHVTTIKEVEKIVNVPLPEIDGVGLEDCAVCKFEKGYILYGCCSIRLCLQCALAVCKTRNCAQCRRPVSTDKMIHCLVKNDDSELEDVIPIKQELELSTVRHVSAQEAILNGKPCWNIRVNRPVSR